MQELIEILERAPTPGARLAMADAFSAGVAERQGSLLDMARIVCIDPCGRTGNAP